MAGAFAFIFDESGKVLLAHRTDHDLWNLPGGKVEPGETPWDAAVREVSEETGLDAQVIRLEGLYYKAEKDEMTYAFLCSATGTPRPSDEADELRYFETTALPDNLSMKQRERILDVAPRRQLDQQNAILKIQTGPSTLGQFRQNVVG